MMERGQREQLPTRRAGYNQKIRIGGMVFHLRTGEFQDGRLGEIFLDCSRAGSSMRAMINALAISVSLGLQHGTPLQVYIKAFKNFGFIPSGPAEGDPRFTEVASILDYVARELESTYLSAEEDNGPRLADTPIAS